MPAVCSLHLPKCGTWAWLGVGSDARHPGLSPTLTGFTSGVSPRRLKLFKSLVSTDFTTRALHDAQEPTPLSTGSCLAPDHQAEPRSYALDARKPLSRLIFHPSGAREKDLTKQILSPLCLPISPSGPRMADYTRGQNAKRESALLRFPSFVWSGRRVSNSRPQPWQGCALPTELLPR